MALFKPNPILGIETLLASEIIAIKRDKLGIDNISGDKIVKRVTTMLQIRNNPKLRSQRKIMTYRFSAAFSDRTREPSNFYLKIFSAV